MPKGKNEKCGGRWNMSGRCITGLNCMKTCNKDWCKRDHDRWYRNLEGRCVNSSKAPVNVQGIFYIEENFIKSNKPVQKCPEIKMFRSWNTPWYTEYTLE